ncbi:MAG TPA: GAF domain-containing protein [Candidatus Sulfotelmatobacter sp.]|nr:GAF domain-containing protein [Candidatus Sulfotelmatobacter sp.]
MDVDSNLEQRVEQGGTTRTQAGISAALAAANPALGSPMRFPGEDGGRSLAQIAERDLDAALQLLSDRAQYITGASGAAIALRRSGRNDMLCRASTGSNVPELGALLSTEFGLSGESVRTRQPLRCDDAERDPRVNREGCRELGIASVVVMPVVNDDEVLGVFELFSGKVNAFCERDLSTLQRLSEMVETAVKLARAAETVTGTIVAEGVPVGEAAVLEAPAPGISDDNILDDEILEVEGPTAPLANEAPVAVEAATVPAAAAVAEVAKAEVAKAEVAKAEVQAVPQTVAKIEAPILPAPLIPLPAPPTLPKKPLFWSAVLTSAADAEKPADADQSHVPPVLRSLRSCEACGFPVSPGRALCVECEEKKWRGQLKRKTTPLPNLDRIAPPSAPSPTPARAFAAAAQAAPAPASVGPAGNTVATPSIGAARTLQTDAQVKAPGAATSAMLPAVAASKPSVSEAVAQMVQTTSDTPSPAFVLSAGMEPSQSWLARNKYIVGALLLVGATVAAIFLLR